MLSNYLNFYLPKKQSLLRKLCIFIKHINKVVLYSLLFLILFNLFSVYFVNSLAMLLLCCCFSQYDCIWLYENNNMYTLIQKWQINDSLSLQVNMIIIWQLINFKKKPVYFPTIELQETCI